MREDEACSATEPHLTLVELFGAPGAGKSTLAAALALRLQVQTRHQLSAAWHRQSSLRKASLVAQGFSVPRRTIAAARLAFGCQLHNRTSIAHLSRVIAKSAWLQSQRGLVLLDQGFLQDLWSALCVSETHIPDPAQISPFLRSVFPGANTTILFIQVNADIAFDRVAGRSNGHSRLDSLPRADLRAWIDRTAQLPVAIVNGARAAGLPVVTLDGSEEIDVLVEQALSALPTHIRASASPKN